MKKVKDDTHPGQDPESRAAVAKQVTEAKAAGKAAMAKQEAAGGPKPMNLPKREQVAKTKPAPDAEDQALQAEANAEAAAEAAAVEVEAKAPRGHEFVYITLSDRKRLMESASTPAAIKTLIGEGVEVRASNGAEKPASIAEIEPRYFPRWRVRVSVTDKQREAITGLVQTVAIGSGATRTATPKATGESEQVAAAKALVAKVDAMPADQASAIVGTDEVQAALGTVASAARGRMIAN